jgi:methionyl-tRNA formyltransferase
MIDHEQRFTLVRARTIESAATESTGVTSGSIDDRGHIRCGNGSIEVVEIQPEAGRPMPFTTYRNGHAWRAGMRVESVG